MTTTVTKNAIGNDATGLNAAATTRDGFAMVTALLVVLVLSVLAVGAAWLATSEQKTTVAEAAHVRSVFAADAGSEAGINFIRNSDTPPMQTFNEADTALEGSQAYSFSAAYQTTRTKPGWGIDYLDFDYGIDALGEAGQSGQSGVAVVVSRLYKTGY